MMSLSKLLYFQSSRSVYDTLGTLKLVIALLLLYVSVYAQQVTPDLDTNLVLLHITHYNLEGETVTGEMIVNRRMADAVRAVFRELYAIHYPIERMTLAQAYADDEASMRANNTSCYLYRTIAGSKRLSKHAEGLAIDVNPLYNPCFRVVDGRPVNVQPATATPYTDRTRTYPCTITPQVVAIFKKHGFSWGGNWRTKKDYQHFEWNK